MSLGTPAHALNVQTNVNANRYFFATAEAGEQDLFLSTLSGGGPLGNISSLAIGISGPAGNAVVASAAPTFIASEFVSADQGIAIPGSTYWTLSTLSTNYGGISMSSDRVPGSGIAAIESYANNGFTGGFEFLSRFTNSQLVSTNNAGINTYISSIGRTGATAVLGSSGTFVTGTTNSAILNSIDVATGGGGRVAFGINDLSGANGASALARWGIGTSVPPAGNNTGSDYTIYSYADSGAFLGAPMAIRRRDGAAVIGNVSSFFTQVSTGVGAQIYPAYRSTVEFGAEGKNEVIAGANSNQSLYGQTWAPLFSTPMVGCNPNGGTFVYINWENALSTGSNHVNYKVGFSTSTAYNNALVTSYVPGGLFSPSDLPSASTPTGHTIVTAVIDPDGVNPDGSAVLYVLGQLSDPTAPADQIFIAKGQASETTRNALSWRPF